MRQRVRWWSAGAGVAIVLAGLAVRSATDDGPPSTAAGASAPPSMSASVSSSPPSPPAVPACAGAVGRLSLGERAGQLLMVGTPVDRPRGLRAAVRRHHLGGVFLAGRSKRPAAALRADIAALQGDAAMPLLVALDQEGGSVQTLKGPDFPLIPSARRLGAGPKAVLRDTVRDNAGRLARVGVSVNLAPVADTVPAGLGEGNPPIGAFHREYGSDPGGVAEDVRTVVPASQGAGVLTILKHFPGLGRVRANTDTSTRAVDRTATVGDAYLEPFVAGIDAGSAGVMISSASYPRLDPEAIAAFSRPIVTGLLRDRFGYTGLIMSDDLGAAQAARAVPVGQRAVRFVRAGGDLVLTIRPQDAGPMTAALIAQARANPAFAARVDDAALHVLEAKQRAGLIRC
ncbi:glycoside hydrolase family 3 N-terminal domain-containing protein [Amorphoplanes digitatis]|uniref:beta-N-acetylhexosaminidase n=1 Tax=Actinoplanes digitatis TaxID=1868 RepID=A0A7W7HXD8_9ACTN|nr:glycoside hydrolase family 3 N-terminal domain-containing protein [Actinoplanes digitatis]MBB4762476.1 beta-N-acetylhexosaminidase [Actinoplanes digitatis]